PAPVLRGGFEDSWLRDRRAAWMALARQCRGADGRRIADHENPQGLRGTHQTWPGGREAGAFLRRAGDGMLSDFEGCEIRQRRDRTAEACDDCALACYRQSRRWALCD